MLISTGNLAKRIRRVIWLDGDGGFSYYVADLSLDFRSEWVYRFVILKQVGVSLFWRFENAVIER
jgi:hypothetical protein